MLRLGFVFVIVERNVHDSAARLISQGLPHSVQRFESERPQLVEWLGQRHPEGLLAITQRIVFGWLELSLGHQGSAYVDLVRNGLRLRWLGVVCRLG